MCCSLLYEFFFVGDKISADNFKEKIIPSLKVNDRIKLAQDVAIDHVRDKGKPRCKLSYRVFIEQDQYDILIETSTFTTLIHLKNVL